MARHIIDLPDDVDGDYLADKVELMFIATREYMRIVCPDDFEPDAEAIRDVIAIVSGLRSATPLRNEQALRPDQVEAIRWRYAQKGHPTQRALAAEYGVHPGTISRIVTGRAYRNTGGPLFPNRPTRTEVPA